MILYKEMVWRYWAATMLLLIAGLARYSGAFYFATALSAIQVLHFRFQEGSFVAFPVQVRIAFTSLLLVALWPPMNWFFWVLAAGTTAFVLFGYCALARCLSLMPWNRRGPLSWRVLWQTFITPPLRGSILQGLPAAS